MDEQCIQILSKGSEQDVIVFLQEFTKQVCTSVSVHFGTRTSFSEKKQRFICHIRQERGS